MNKFLETKIRQKAKWVTRRYPELRENDLIQEACELVVKLQKKKGRDIPVPYLLKSISFHFSNLMRTTNTRRNIKLLSFLSMTNLIDLSTEQEFQDLENRIDRERFIESLKDTNLMKVMSSLMAGYNPKEIAKENHMSIRNVYRCIVRLAGLRETWER